jgi:hypothetical protein
MKIISPRESRDTEKDAIVMIFKNDDELNSFMTQLATTPVRTSGLRIVSFIPPHLTLSPKQTAILIIIDGLDGVGCNNRAASDKILDDSIDGIREMINSGQITPKQ